MTVHFNSEGTEAHIQMPNGDFVNYVAKSEIQHRMEAAVNSALILSTSNSDALRWKVSILEDELRQRKEWVREAKRRAGFPVWESFDALFAKMLEAYKQHCKTETPNTK